jgi:hypothetical protein
VGSDARSRSPFGTSRVELEAGLAINADENASYAWRRKEEAAYSNEGNAVRAADGFHPS